MAVPEMDEEPKAPAMIGDPRLAAKTRRRTWAAGGGILLLGMAIGASAMLLAADRAGWLRHGGQPGAPGGEIDEDDDDEIETELPDPPEQNEWVTNYSARYARILQLTDPQREAIEGHLASHYRVMDALVRQAADRRRQLRRDIRTLFTDQQRDLWQAHIERMAERRPDRARQGAGRGAGRGSGGGMGGGGPRGEPGGANAAED